MSLPRFVVARKRPAGTVYYWQVPPRLRVQGETEIWPVGITRLPDTYAEMIAVATKLNRELDTLRSGASEGSGKSLPWLIRQYEQSSYYTCLRDKTKESYTLMARYVTKWSASRSHPAVISLTTPKVLEFLAQYDSRKSMRDHLAKYLAVVLEFARRTGLIAVNPARRLGLKRAKRLKPIRTVTVEQVLAIAAKAREMGLPHIAIGTLLHFDLGQRQGDMLRLQKPRDYRDGVFHFHQSKTDQIVTIKPFLRETRAALDALPATQMMLVARKDGLIIHPRIYWQDFRAVANACGFRDLWEMELRHSCVIYMEQAGLTPGEIATRTGHGLASVITILENYRYRDPVVASQGAVKLEDYRNRSVTESTESRSNSSQSGRQFPSALPASHPCP
jgi:hypothetical protein